MTTTDIDPPAPSGPLAPDFPPFEPHPLLPGGNIQTLAGHVMSQRIAPIEADRFEIDLDDGDRLVLLENAPPDDSPDRPIALLIHGLAGCAESLYQVRFTGRLLRLGIRVARVNLRNAGGGHGLSRGVYHGGRSEDVRRVVEWLARRFPDAPIGLIGFSLGGNIALKLAGEASLRPVPNLDCVLAANPPIDLSACCAYIRQFPRSVYDRYFVRQVLADVRRLHAVLPDLGVLDPPRIRSMFDFDEFYTAPRSGFSGAEDYYRRASASPLIPAIAVPGLVVHAMDDPFIPSSPFFLADFPSQVRLEVASRGGHLGYVSRTRWGGDRRWLDARFASWLARRWHLSPAPGGPILRAGIDPATPPRTGSQERSCPDPSPLPRSTARPPRS